MPYEFTELSFKLSAVNWQSVSLLEGAHLDADRVYLEELLRCAVFFTGRTGVVGLGESDLIPGSPSSDAVNVRLKRCMALTPRGYLVFWDSENQFGEVVGSASTTRAAESVPLYLCVDAERTQAYAEPPQELRNECSFVRRALHLSTRPEDAELDALQIGRFRRSPDTNRLELDKTFIPECLRLDSHWLLKQRIEEIQQKAQTCLTNLMEQLKSGDFHLDPMAAPLGMASVLVDWTVSPYTYLERMLAVIKTNFALHYLIPRERQAGIYQTHDDAIKYIEPALRTGALDWTVALARIEETFTKLSSAFTGQSTGERKIFIKDRPIS